MDMNAARQKELLVMFAGFISAMPYNERAYITDEVNEVLEAINVSKEVANPN